MDETFNDIIDYIDGSMDTAHRSIESTRDNLKELAKYVYDRMPGVNVDQTVSIILTLLASGIKTYMENMIYATDEESYNYINQIAVLGLHYQIAFPGEVDVSELITISIGDFVRNIDSIIRAISVGKAPSMFYESRL